MYRRPGGRIDPMELDGVSLANVFKTLRQNAAICVLNRIANLYRAISSKPGDYGLLDAPTPSNLSRYIEGRYHDNTASWDSEWNFNFLIDVYIAYGMYFLVPWVGAGMKDEKISPFMTRRMGICIYPSYMGKINNESERKWIEEENRLWEVSIDRFSERIQERRVIGAFPYMPAPDFTMLVSAPSLWRLIDPLPRFQSGNTGPLGYRAVLDVSEEPEEKAPEAPFVRGRKVL